MFNVNIIYNDYNHTNLKINKNINLKGNKVAFMNKNEIENRKMNLVEMLRKRPKRKCHYTKSNIQSLKFLEKLENRKFDAKCDFEDVMKFF